MPKLIPQCQHVQLVPCYQDATTFKCKEKCPKSCQQGHPCPKVCGEHCGQCSTMVEKVIPECSHRVLLPCSVDPVHENCTIPCEKELKCGHKCQSKCGERCTIICQIKSQKQLSCEHYVEVPCYQNRLPGYNIIDYTIRCKKQCEKLLPCNHPCKHLCYQRCTEKCAFVVDKVRACGHSIKTKCYQSEKTERNPCVQKCERKLPCGHLCTLQCGEPCASTCSVLIQQTLPCGHICSTTCEESDMTICSVKIKKTLPCGHSVPSFCGEQNPVCNVKVLRKLSCRHKKWLACHEDPKQSRIRCDHFCKFELACGHRCSGICSDCNQKRFHQPCKYGFDLQRFCGHRGSVQCVDMDDVHPGKQKKHLANCIHQDCSHDCFSPCLPCDQPCPWTCPHYSCTKLCHEVCDRPPCNEKCSLRLKCGHQCASVCGEPCLTVCPECQQKMFNKLLVKPSHYEPLYLYVQLTCKHIFSLDFLDKYIEETTGKAAISPVCCPKCQQPLTYNYRFSKDL